MAVTVETLDKLERKITLSLPVGTIQNEVDSRLKRLARTVKMDGFRPGKVPMNVVAQRYGYSVQYEVMNDKVGEAFAVAANEANLRVAGQPRISEKEGAPEGQLQFDAVFEVYPEVTIKDLGSAEVERVSSQVTEEAIDKTVEILRKQRRTFSQRAAADAAIDSSFREMAKLRAALLRLDQADAGELQRRLEPLAQAGQPFRNSARELLGLAALKRGDLETAGKWLDMIVVDAQAPADIRQRAEALLGLVSAGKR